MNKLIIGLLIVAAGAGVFFFLRSKKETPASKINKELLTGKWKPVDDTSGKTSFDFQKDGRVISLAGDSARADTSYYAWNKTNELVWKEKPTDSSGKVYSVLALSIDSLRVLGRDSSIMRFVKTK
ncbi:MAG: hypothetical protein ABIR30_13360 [Chitinophagaceae bacterium]